MTTFQERLIITDDGEFDLNNDSDTRAAQSFTLGTTGGNFTFTITSIDVKIKKTLGPVTLNWKIQSTSPDGTPSGTTIASGSISAASVSTTAGWVNSIADVTGTLVKDGLYVLVLIPVTASGSDKFHWRYDGSSPTYTGGSVFTSTNGGINWTVDTAKDFMFSINGGAFSGTLCTFSEASNKAGANANTNSINEVIVNEYVLQAESHINSVTRFNWVDAYSGLDDELKLILNKLCSQLAAINIITYDMSGYTAATAEAETMVNIYRDDNEKLFELLKDQKVKVFIETGV